MREISWFFLYRLEDNFLHLFSEKTPHVLIVNLLLLSSSLLLRKGRNGICKSQDK
nr:MAG TPA: Protein of unknown function (DUF2660) [Caudoviricetes sp.]